MVRRIIFGILFFIWTILLILLSVIPNSDSLLDQDISEFRWDYLEHFVFYFILTFFYIFWRSNQKYTIRITELILFLIAGFIFCWLTEYIQIFIPGRSFNILDMASNMAGMIAGIFICYYLILRILIRNYFSQKSL